MMMSIVLMEIKHVGLLAHIDYDTPSVQKIHFDSVEDYVKYLQNITTPMSTYWTKREGISKRRYKDVIKELDYFDDYFYGKK